LAQLSTLEIAMNPRDSQSVFDSPDFDIHTIWYCQHSDDPDFVFIPVIGATEVTQEICRKDFPCIPLRVEDTDLRCLGYYDVGKDTVFGVTVWIVGEWRKFSYIEGPRTPVVVVSQVPIFGVSKRRFLQRDEKDWYAEKLNA
jgi:hypothetical protein